MYLLPFSELDEKYFVEWFGRNINDMQLPYDFYNHITYTYFNPEFRCAQALSGLDIEEFEVLHLISETTYNYQADFESLISNNPEFKNINVQY